MTFIDEKIATLKQTKRILKEEEKQQNQQNETNDDPKEPISFKEVIEYIKKGYLEIEDRKFYLKRENYLDGKISMPMIENYFEEVTNDDKTLVFKNEIDGVSFTCSHIKENILSMTLMHLNREWRKI